MRRTGFRHSIGLTLAVCVLTALAVHAQFVFRSGVDLVYVTATVTEKNGRVISDLTEQDFTVFDDGKQQEIVSFTRGRVPVSVGIVLDASGSMTPDKMTAARAAIRRFTEELLRPDDQLFVATFGVRTWLRQSWTTDRDKLNAALDGTRTEWGTALYDAVRTTLPIAATGERNKKALLVLSDGDDRNSRTPLKVVQEMIRASDVLVYALGVEGGDGIDAGNLRKITDVTGGRTEIVKGFKNLDAATARLADELNQQYTIAYATPHAKDGALHNIKVEVRRKGATVRSRSGYQSAKEDGLSTP